MTNLTGLLFFLLSFTSLTMAAPVELKPLTAPNGDMQFGFHCSYDDVESFSWSLLMNADKQLPKHVQWSAYLTTTKQYLGEWSDLETRGSLMTFGDKNFDTGKAVLLGLADVEIHFRSSAGGPVEFYFPLGNYRNQFKTYFLDLTNGNLACKITASDLPKVSNACADLREQFQDYINKNLITCEIANRQLAKKNCMPLSCK